MGKRTADQEEKKVIMTFTVAECGEYHSLGEYHEGIGTLEEAVMLYSLNSALNYNEEGTGAFILNALKIAL